MERRWLADLVGSFMVPVGITADTDTLQLQSKAERDAEPLPAYQASLPSYDDANAAM